MAEVLKLQADQTLPPIENMVRAEDVVSVCETKIENINSLFETAQFILSEFQGPLFKIREEREEVSSQLKDLLAENEHLRRTDFNRMTEGILTLQDEKEREIRGLLNDYLAEQKQMVGLLRDNLAKSKAALSVGNAQEIEECRESIGGILERQDRGKQEIILKLKEFQKEQKHITQALLELLSKGKELKVKDFKTMLKEFDVRHKERLAQRAERKIEVQKRKEAVSGMLVEFKKKREDLVKSRKNKAVPSGKEKTTKTQTTKHGN